MDETSFREELARDGFDDVQISWSAGKTNPEHAHDYYVRALVLDGEITLTVAGKADCYGAGQVFTMPRGCAHSEFIGPDGLRALVGRRRSQDEAAA